MWHKLSPFSHYGLIITKGAKSKQVRKIGLSGFISQLRSIKIFGTDDLLVNKAAILTTTTYRRSEFLETR